MMKKFELDLFDCAARICELTSRHPQDYDLAVLSYLEELGELSAELKIYLKVPGAEYKKPGSDGVYGECADLWICGVYLRFLREGLADDGDETIAVLSKEARWDVSRLDLRDSIKALVKHPMDISKVESLCIDIALNFDSDLEHFVAKINEKLDKWERNISK